MSMIIRKRYDKPLKVTSDPVGESKTKQAFKEESDVNNIIRKHKKLGLPLPGPGPNGRYGDFTKVTDYQTAINQVMAAEQTFMMLPAKVREKFGNDPGAFLAFADDPKNAQELIAMGLGAPPSPAGSKPATAKPEASKDKEANAPKPSEKDS